ncbi:hypothetical protein DOY81_014674, partial [Sarcophaga bullata]
KTPADHCTVLINNKTVFKEVGSVWISPQDACGLHSCELNKLGEPQEVIRKDNCGDFYCDVDSEVRPKAGTCCGECVRTKCRFKDKVYDVGQTWHNADDCTLNECSLLPNGQPMINSYKKSCPPMPTNCPADQIYMENCCQYCNSSTVARNSYRSNEIDNESDRTIWTRRVYIERLIAWQTVETVNGLDESSPRKCYVVTHHVGLWDND